MVFAQIPDEMTEEMLEKAVHQQLFLGDDEIMGRMPANTMHFKDIGWLLSEFIRNIKKKLHLINPEDFDDFLSYFEDIFDLDLGETRKRVKNNFIGMGDLSGQEIVVLYMVLTKLLENVREQAYRKFGYERIEQEFEERTGHKVDPESMERIQTLGAIGERNMSLLYNLCFIRLLADKFNKKNMVTNAKRQITMKINQLFDKLLKKD